jgi:DNA repair protein RadD
MEKIIILRPYQEAAIEAVVAALQQERYVLLQAATGAGKTLVFCELIKRFLRDYPMMRIGVLAHRRELIIQAADKLRRVWPHAPIGITCAGLSREKSSSSPIIIGTIQTLVGVLKKTAPFQLLIVVEAHRLPPRNQPSQYKRFLEAMGQQFPGMRVLGVTATPYRLGHGYIHGFECKESNLNWFQDLHFKIGIWDLQQQGYLCGIRAKEVENLDSELVGIKSSGGDFNLADLSELMSKEIHVGSALKAYQEYGENRRHVIVFCVTIDHAEKIMKVFREAGYPTGCVHSKMSLSARDAVLADFARGNIRILTNVGVLTEGWDSPHVDLILMCRPTKSPGLYVQMVGRGTRIHPGKEDLLILDLSSNIHAHGDPDNPHIIIPRGKKQTAPPPATKTCPECRTIVPAGLLECPECGYLWDPPKYEEIHEAVKMRDVQIHRRHQRDDAQTVQLRNVFHRKHVSRAGNVMLKLMLSCAEPDTNMPIQLNHFLDIEGNGSEYGARRAAHLWKKLSGTNGNFQVPKTIEEALDRFDELTFPDEIQIRPDGKYYKVIGW